MHIRTISKFAAIAICAVATLTAAAAQQNPQGGAAPAAAPATPPAPPMRLTSSAFADSTPIPAKYTCSGQPAAVSPPLAWTDAPAGTMSFVLILHDLEPHPRKGAEDNLHWMMWNIPATATSLPEGVPSASVDLPDGSRQSMGTAPVPGFHGPCPAMGVNLNHHYAFELFALDNKLDLVAGSTRAQVLSAIDGHIIGHAVLMGLFHR